ncbi:hypothetical protein HHI36_011297 [Cryptolaemus montrouzieri]|uniref:Uncharacterized protein n=1 Tax=Cryptolaemus montrouzieri TaxID=559131 RepID=A0ABD2ML95_9CUCU
MEWMTCRGEKFRSVQAFWQIRNYIEQDLPNKSHSTCSDGSLLSVGSSDIEEDLLGTQLRHPSKSSLSESKQDTDAPSIPLNHSAAHHRVAVRPKKTHGVPRRKRVQQLPNTLPTTIEVNEDSFIRSASPETNTKVALGSDNKLNRSKSNAGSKSQDALEEHTEKEEKCDRSFFERLFPRRSAKKKKSKHDEKKQEEKKMKFEEHYSKQEDKRRIEDIKVEKYNSRDESSSFHTNFKQTESYRRYESKPIPAVRSGAAYRQRVMPIDVPDSPEVLRKEEELVTTKSQLPDILSTSPLQMELENKLKHRLTRSSPPQNSEVPDVPPQAMDSSAEQKIEQIHSQQSRTFHYFESRKSDDTKSKAKIAGLSSLQQKVLTLNEDEADYHNFKSLTEFPSSPQNTNVLLTKSHSFKTVKSTTIQNTSTTDVSSSKISFNKDCKENFMGKSSSLDSVKIFNDQANETIHNSITQTSSEKIEFRRQTKQQTIEIKCDITVNEHDNLDEQITKCMIETKRLCDSYPEKNHITISGPSHTAVVNIINKEHFNISSEERQSNVEVIEKNSPKEHLISVTKINVLPENEQISPDSPISLETKSLVLSKSPKIYSDQMKTKPIFNFEVDQQVNSRNPSRDDVDIVNKEENNQSEISKASPVFTISPISSAAPLFKKNEKSTPKKSSLVMITPETSSRDKSITSCKSSSLDSLTSDHLDSTDKSSQDSLDNVIDKPFVHPREKVDNVVLRKKTSFKQNKDDEPELMKVFARRSLKLKDTETEIINQELSVMIKENCDKSRDSDKENQTDSPVKERRKSSFVESMEHMKRKSENEFPHRRKSSSKSDEENQDRMSESDTNALRKKSLNFELEKKEKEPLIESNIVHSKPIPIRRNSRPENNSQESSDVSLRKPSVEQTYPRSVSVNSSKAIENSQNILRKQFVSRRKTDNWITNLKNEESDREKEALKEDHHSPKEEIVNELIIEPKNFNQRKAEWEKRAQEAQKKSTP